MHVGLEMEKENGNPGRGKVRKKNKIKYLIIFMGMVPSVAHLFHPTGNIHISYFI